MDRVELHIVIERNKLHDRARSPSSYQKYDARCSELDLHATGASPDDALSAIANQIIGYMIGSKGIGKRLEDHIK